MCCVPRCGFGGCCGGCGGGWRFAPAEVEFSADDLMSILLHVMAMGVDEHTTAAIIADLDYIQKFHFVPMTQSELG
jgi:hypothetical protein